MQSKSQINIRASQSLIKLNLNVIISCFVKLLEFSKGMMKMRSMEYMSFLMLDAYNEMIPAALNHFATRFLFSVEVLLECC